MSKLAVSLDTDSRLYIIGLLMLTCLAVDYSFDLVQVEFSAVEIEFVGQKPPVFDKRRWFEGNSYLLFTLKLFQNR